MSRLEELRRAWATPRLLRATLFCLPLIDELVGSIPVLTLPLAREELHFSYAQVGLIFTVSELSGLLVNPVINAASDHWPKPRLVLAGILGMVLGFALAGSSPTFGWLLLGFMVIGATNSTAVGLGGAVLIDQTPDATLTITTRWVFLATIGDLLGPLLVAAAITLEGSWRLLMGGSALLWFAIALFLSAQRFTAVESGRQVEVYEQPLWRTVRTNLKTGLQTPHLLRWLLLAAIPTLLDELFLGFAALFLTDIVGLSANVLSLALLAPIIGALLSLALMDRLGKMIAASRLLELAALVTLVGLSGFVMAQSLWPALLGLFLTGLGAAPWYPVAVAQAFDLLPGRSGTVRTLQSLFAPFEIAAPLLVGLAAEQWGIQAGVGVLLVAPILIVIALPRSGR
jgi:MFS family permease